MKLATKTLYSAALAGLLLAGTPFLAQAWEAGGYVVCDANQNDEFDKDDAGLSGVLVVVTNTSGVFSNANWSSTEGGGYAVLLPPVADSYVAYLHPDTLPTDATIVVPPAGYYSFTLDGTTQSNFVGSFLVSSSLCTNIPPEPSQTNDCCVAGIAKLGGTKYCPEFIVAGALRTGEEDAKWEVLALELKLRFEAEAVEVIDCQIVNEGQPDQYRFIEFEGIGTLKGVAGYYTNYGLVYFQARVEDLGGKYAADRLYFRAYAEDGTTLLLISSDLDTPLNIAPAPVVYGGFAVGVNDCDFDKVCPDKKKHDKGDKNEGKGKAKGKAKGHDKKEDKGKGDDNKDDKYGKGDDKKDDKGQDKKDTGKSSKSKSGKSGGKKN